MKKPTSWPDNQDILERVFVHTDCCDDCWEARHLLREAATGWEPGPGPFEVPLPVVNKIINLLSR